ncbi:hypothetical protein [Burkholderia multivorans]|uniref:hypothetical protein n=1 Tax=Burkholderia multivorans TaxID=87883 RepID=UPI001C24FFE7|nr:hypothetical protein [Burkholderia multivorans]MBU9162149.1 hypothetical protein [Burkholderia multivorans]
MAPASQAQPVGPPADRYAGDHSDAVRTTGMSRLDCTLLGICLLAIAMAAMGSGSCTVDEVRDIQRSPGVSARARAACARAAVVGCIDMVAHTTIVARFI